MNPFQIILNALWASLDRPALLALVPEGNRHKFADNIPVKEEIATRDRPELRIVPVAGLFNPNITNADTEITKQFQIQAITGSRKLAPVSELEFEIFRAVLAPDFDELEWEGKSFVQNVRIVSATEMEKNQDLNQGIVGWVTILTVQVSMIFQTSDLVKEA